jgi:hypothetical protein
MKRSAAVLLLLVCSVGLVGGVNAQSEQKPQKARQGVDYPIKIHVSGVHLRKQCAGSFNGVPFCTDVIYADAIRNGQKIELMGDRNPLLPGDYQARLVKAGQAAAADPLGEKYELVFPDRTIWRCTVTGMSE